jgi:TRAP-type C4-dicarboxylate transport system substrate-binding protein
MGTMKMTTSNRLATLALGLALLPAVAAADEPVTLKLAFFTSDRSGIYERSVRPFVEAVNAEGKGLVEIEVHFSGALGKALNEQANLVLQGAADLAFVVPGYSPQQFPDNSLLELPGLFRDMHEATAVYTRLVADGALRGYEQFVVIGAFASAPETIHSRKPISRIGDLAGLKIRTNNLTQAAALAKLGATPVSLPITQVATSLSSGRIDAATVPPAAMHEFGISRVAGNHYLLPTTVPPTALVMGRKSFERLPAEAQAIIRKHAGSWMAERFVEISDQIDKRVIDEIMADGRRNVILPSENDLRTARTKYKEVVDEWATTTRNRELLARVEREIASLRSAR